MIGVKGQYEALFSIGPFQDFINEQDFRKLQVTSTCGGNMPSFELIFATNNLDLLGYLNEHQVLVIQIGDSISDSTSTSWKIAYPSIDQGGNDLYVVTLKGVPSLTYVNNPVTKIFSKKKSTEVVAAASGSSGFSFESNIESDDKMNWIQPGISNWEFIQDTYMRYWVDGKSSAAIAVTHDNKFRMKDIRKLINDKRGGPDWTIHNALEGAKGSTDIITAGGLSSQSGNAFMNHWGGYGTKYYEESIVTGETTLVSSSVAVDDTMFSSVGISSQISNAENVDPTYIEPDLLVDDNVHGNWNVAYTNNRTRLARSSSNRVSFSYSNLFYNIRPLDVALVMSVEIASESSSIKQSIFNRMYAGLYLVEQHTFTIENRTVSGFVTLTRDANGEQVK